jgi:hypothetical protein
VATLLQQDVCELWCKVTSAKAWLLRYHRYYDDFCDAYHEMSWLLEQYDASVGARCILEQHDESVGGRCRLGHLEPDVRDAVLCLQRTGVALGLSCKAHAKQADVSIKKWLEAWGAVSHEFCRAFEANEEALPGLRRRWAEAARLLWRVKYLQRANK